MTFDYYVVGFTLVVSYFYPCFHWWDGMFRMGMHPGLSMITLVLKFFALMRTF